MESPGAGNLRHIQYYHDKSDISSYLREKKETIQ